MRIITYNCNSVTTRLTRILALLEEHDPDVVLLQETKVAAEQFPHEAFGDAGYVAADHSGGRWAGVAVLARTTLGLTDVTRGLPGEPDPDEARWVEATVGDQLRAVSVYVPNGRALGTPTFAAKLAFLDRMAERAADLATGPALIAGDFNVCPTDLDSYGGIRFKGKIHHTDEERALIARLCAAGLVDLFRTRYPDEPGFSWWDYRAGSFHKKEGMRIDLLLATPAIASRVTEVYVDREFRKKGKASGSIPSDHAPVVAVVE